METNELMRDVFARTNGEFYLGVVGAVRTGKSTFIKKFMESLVIPLVEDENVKKRMIDTSPSTVTLTACAGTNFGSVVIIVFPLAL